MPSEAVIGWDIGGAQLKVAHRNPQGVFESIFQMACPLWKGLDVLEKAIGEALKQLPANATHAVTMSGELVDLFSGRAEGVERF